MQRIPLAQEPGEEQQSLTQGYMRLYGHRAGVLFVSWITAIVLSFGAGGTMILSDLMEPFFRDEADTAWLDFTDRLADAVAVLSLVFSPICLVVAFGLSISMVYPKDLPSWTTPEQLRAAKVLVRNTVVGNDHRTALVARVYAERLGARIGVLPLRLLTSVSCVLGGFLVLGGLYVTTRAVQSGDLSGLAAGVNGVLLFSLFTSVYPVQMRRLRKLRAFCDLHDATYHGTHG